MPCEEHLAPRRAQAVEPALAPSRLGTTPSRQDAGRSRRGREAFTAARSAEASTLPADGQALSGSAEQTRRNRSPSIAAGLSFLWPGLGQLFLGRQVAAAFLAVPALLATAVIVLQLSQGPLMVAASLWDESYFLAAAALVIALGMWRVAAVALAFMAAEGSRRPNLKSPAAVFAACLMAVILATHGLFVAGTWAWYQTSVSIQGNDLFADATPSGSAPGPTATPTPRDTTSYKPYPTNGPTATPAPTPNRNRITFLLVGIDFMSGRDHSLTDTLMLVSADIGTGKVAIVSVPRDTAYFPLYYGGWVGPAFKINTLWTASMSSSFGSPDPPMKTLENEIGYLVGIPVNYYAAVDLDGFAKMVDALGGVDVYNPHAINDPGTGIVLGAGQVHLDGPTAMLYVRSREGAGDNDYTRAARQQAVLVAVEHKVVSADGLPQLGTLLSLAGKTIATDFPLSKARDYVPAAEHASRIENCVLGPPYSVHPDMSLSGGTWTSRLDLDLVANLSVELFGQESRYHGQPGVAPAACGA